MHPPNEVTGLALLIGLMLGALLGLNGFAEPVQAKEWKNSTRVRNFAWLFTGMIGVVLADYKRLGFGEEIRPISMTVWYSSGAALGLVGSIAVMCMTIARSAWVWNRPRPPHSRIDAWAMMREYLTYGKSRFDEKWAADTSGLERRVDAERRAGVARADKDVARCVFSVLQHVKRPEAVRASEAGLLIESVIAAAILVIRSHSRHPREIRLAGSYMTFISASEASERLRENALFCFGSRDRYTGFLQLRHGAGVAVGREVILPVDGSSSSSEKVLPGAPEAVVEQGIFIVNAKNIDFRKGVPRQVCADVRKFFKDATFNFCDMHRGLRWPARPRRTKHRIVREGSAG